MADPGYDLTQDPYYQQIQNQMLGVGGYWSPDNTTNTLNDQVTQFASMYQNMTGQAPTQDVINAYSQNLQTGILDSPTGEVGSNYSSNQALDTPYIQNTYGPQITQNQTNQAQNQLAQAQTAEQGSINQMDANTQAYLTSPNAQANIQGQLNNNGMLDSGAYDTTMASLMSQGALQNENSAISGLTTPAEANIVGMSSSPYMNTVAGSAGGLANFGQNQINQSDFNQQTALGQMLAQMAEPSGAQQDLGMAASASQAAGSLGNSGKPSWICTAMREAGVLAQCEVNRLHDHLFAAFKPRFFSFIGYFVFGKLAVWAAQMRGVDWMEWRPVFYDRVIAERDPARAVDLYKKAFWGLVKETMSSQEVSYGTQQSD